MFNLLQCHVIVTTHAQNIKSLDPVFVPIPDSYAWNTNLCGALIRKVGVVSSKDGSGAGKTWIW